VAQGGFAKQAAVPQWLVDRRLVASLRSRPTILSVFPVFLSLLRALGGFA